MTDASTTDGTAVSGELVELPEAAVIPSDAEVTAAAERARGRTAVQVTLPTALVIIAEWLCAMQSWDLDPWSEGTGFPVTVAGAFIAVATWLMAVRMNPKPKG